MTLEQFDKDRWRDRDVMALVGKTTVKPAAGLMAKLPKGRGASVEVIFADGASLHETVEVPEGDAQRPLSRASLDRKFMTAATPVFGTAVAKRVLSQVDALEMLADVGELSRELRKPA